MADIFNHKILCNKCGIKMEKAEICKNGFVLRALKCPKNHEILIHPEDKSEYEDFMKLKQKEYEVKMRMVGNSYAVSIPREIVDFMKEQERMISDMVKLSFERAGRLRLMFNISDNEDSLNPEKSNNKKSRVVKSSEVKIIKNNKPFFHARQFSDSSNPNKNRTEVLKGNRDKKRSGKNE